MMNIQQELRSIKKAKGGWYNKRFDAWFHFLFAAGVGAAEIAQQRLPVYMHCGCWIINGHTYDWFWSKADLRRVRNWIIRKNSSSLRHINALISSWRRDEQAFAKQYRWFETHDWKKLSDNMLADRYDRLYQAYTWCNSLPYLADSFLTSGEEDAVSKELQLFLENDVLPVDLPEIIQKLTAPIYDSFINRAQKSLLRLALHVERTPGLRRALTRSGTRVFSKLEQYPRFRYALARHVQSFHWIHNNYYQVKHLGEQFVLAEIKKLFANKANIQAALHTEELLHSKNRQTKRRLIRTLHMPKRLQNLIRLSEKITRWQDDRKSAVYRVNSVMFLVLREAVRRTGIPWPELVMTTREEFRAALAKKQFNRPVWRERMRRAIAVHTKHGSFVLTGRQSQLLQAKQFFGNLNALRQLVGIPASPGLVRGKVRIVDDTKSLRRMRAREILVANNTTPDYVPAMRLAAAIVTEQGGITGHAAIVSRELGVPCMVGVEQVTKTLKNGDRVEVDATKGIVKKLT